MKISGWQWGIGVVAVVTLAGVGVVVWQGRSGGASPKPAAVADGARAIAEVDRAASANGSQGRPKKRTRKIADPRDDMSAADRALYDAVQEALDADDFARTRAAALRAYRSANPDVRLQAVEALGWFGEKALVDLVPMMGDANEDVAQEAANAWEGGLAEVEDTSLKLAFARTALKAISDANALTMIGAQFSSAATEYIDEVDEGTEESLDRRVDVLQSLVDMIGSSNNSLSDVGRDLYEEITGHNWINMDEAELYLKDPDNYEPPESSDGATSDASM